MADVEKINVNGLYEIADSTARAAASQVGDLKDALSYKANKKYGGTEAPTDVIMTNKSAWNASGNRITVGQTRRASSPLITITPDMKRVDCASGYAMAVFANDSGAGNAMTNIGSSTWVSTVSLEDTPYRYLAISIKKSDESEFADGTTSDVITLVKSAEVLPYALQSDVQTIDTRSQTNTTDIANLKTTVAADVGPTKYVLPVKSGTIGATGIEDGRTSRIISTEFIYISNYTGAIGIQDGHAIMVAYYDVNMTWISNSSWMTSAAVEDLLGYPYVRIVARNNSRLNDDISDELSTIQITLDKIIDSNSVLTDKGNGEGFFVNPIETGGLIQVGRLGWKVYDNDTPPEQSIPSFVLAYKNGCRVMLADLRVTRDGAFVCRHDDNLGGNTVTRLDGQDMTQQEKELKIADLDIADIDSTYDFGQYKGTRYAGTKILRLENFLRFCKMMNCTAMLETKVMLTAEQTEEVADMVIKLGMYDHIIWAEQAYNSWAGVTVPVIKRMLPLAKFHFRGGALNLANCLQYAMDTATPQNHAEIGFLDDLSGFTPAVEAQFIANNIDLAFSEIKYASTLESMIASGIIYKIKSAACSYINLGKYFADKYKGSNITA